jgi:hypothetical protein
MVAVKADVAMGLPSPQASDDREATGVVLCGLRRLFTSEVSDEQLYKDLEALPHGASSLISADGISNVLNQQAAEVAA